MKCPTCRTRLIYLKKRGILVLHCPLCQGLWFEKDMLVRFLDTPDKRLVQPEIVREPETIINGYVENGFCPHCAKLMCTREAGYYNASFIQCRQCEGTFVRPLALSALGYLRQQEVWSEVKRMIKYSEEQEADAVARANWWKAVIGLIENDNPRKNFPYATVAIMAANALMFIFSLLAPVTARDLRFVPLTLWNDPAVGVLTLFTSMFLHGGFWHIFGNMYMLWIFGVNVEDILGIPVYAVLYICFGLVGGVCEGLFTSVPDMPILGASGAVAGIMGGYLFLYPKSRITFSMLAFWFIPIKFRLSAWFYLGIYFFGTQMISMLRDVPGIAWWAHISAFIAGFFTLMCLKKLDMV